MAKFELATVVELPVATVTAAFANKFNDPQIAAQAEVNYYVNVLANNRPTKNEILGYGLAIERLVKLQHNIGE